jgi:hypothetical protein
MRLRVTACTEKPLLASLKAHTNIARSSHTVQPMPEGHHCTRTGHPLSARGYFSAAFMILKTGARSEFRYPECGQPRYLKPHLPVSRDFAEQKKNQKFMRRTVCRSISPMQTDLLRTVLVLTERPTPERR